jgi:MinD-like ATPase involved in chromosome partitioning or flagellar assembly/tetratricopeptide (TPR) repeat protein
LLTITFYSYKGGTGRTLVVANVARYLAMFGQRVVAVDFDLEAPGLHYKLNVAEIGGASPVMRGVIDFIHSYHEEQKLPEKLIDYTVEVPVSAGSTGTIRLMPAGAAPSSEYWHKLSQINWHDYFYSPGGPGVPLFLELKARIESELNADVLLIDSRTGITEIGGVATTILADKVVCLLLNNRENIEGARAVLRSLRKAPRLEGMQPVDVVPVLTRIPSARTPDVEQGVAKDIRDYLTEQAELLEETLEVSDVLVLHSEPDLQLAERVLVGGERPPDESPLLRDYLRLFAKIIPPNVVRPHVGEQLARIRSAVFDDPDASQQELENLAQYVGHPDVYRELLRLYKVRNTDSDVVLRAAERLWDITQDASDVTLLDAVQRHFKEIPSPRLARKQSVSLRFVEEMWRAAGAEHVKVGIDLAKSFDNQEEGDHAANILLELVSKVGPNEEALVRCLSQLRRAGRLKEFRQVLEQFRTLLPRSDKLLTEWARAEVRQPETPSNELLDSISIDRILREDPSTAVALLVRGGKSDEALALLPRLLERTYDRGPSEELFNVGVMYAELGKSEEFEKAVRDRFPDDIAEHVVSNVKRHPSRRRPYR